MGFRTFEKPYCNYCNCNRNQPLTKEGVRMSGAFLCYAIMELSDDLLLHNDFLAIDDVEALGGVLYALTAEIIDCA